MAATATFVPEDVAVALALMVNLFGVVLVSIARIREFVVIPEVPVRNIPTARPAVFEQLRVPLPLVVLQVV